MIIEKEGREGAPPSAGERQRRVVLLIEDNANDRDLYGSILWYNGYDVLHAGDGATGLEVARSRKPDLILLDLGLPGGMGGLEVLHRMREEGLDIPAIALTATPREELGPAADHFLAYIEKPVAPVEVVREVQRRLGYAR